MTTTHAYRGSIASAVAGAAGLQGRVMWCDAEANLWELSTREGVKETVKRCRDCGINTIILDVKPLAGLVLYDSKIAPRLDEWNGRPYTKNYDLLRVTVDECRRAGLGVYAAVNVFAEGSQARGDGPAYDHPEWQCMQYESDPSGTPRIVRVAESSAEHLAVFVNPAMDEVRQYELSIIGEIVAGYDVDGIVLDRMRYPSFYSDFSDLSRALFEDYHGTKVSSWPEDIFRISSDGSIERGTLFKEWIEWRASVIRSFVEDVRRTVKGVRSDALVGAYVGSWYSEYWGVGVNWGSPGYVPDLDWTTPTYNTTGYADLVDFMCTGCYYENATRSDARTRGADEELTVEAGGEMSVRAIRDDTFVYGSLYVLQYATKSVEFEKAIKACLDTTQGIMIFDLCYIRDYDWWDLLKGIFHSPARPPHEIHGLLERIRDIRGLLEKELT